MRLLGAWKLPVLPIAAAAGSEVSTGVSPRAAPRLARNFGLAALLLTAGALGGLLSTAPAQTAPSLWSDPQTGLTWTAADNGHAVTASQAARYCRTLTLGGHKDWSLPTIDDLHRLFGGPATEGGYHIAAPIKLTGWQWSSSAGQQHGEQWALDFGDGGRAAVVTGDSGLNRALCVRRPEKQ